MQFLFENRNYSLYLENVNLLVDWDKCKQESLMLDKINEPFFLPFYNIIKISLNRMGFSINLQDYSLEYNTTTDLLSNLVDYVISNGSSSNLDLITISGGIFAMNLIYISIFSLTCIGNIDFKNNATSKGLLHRKFARPDAILGDLLLIKNIINKKKDFIQEKFPSIIRDFDNFELNIKFISKFLQKAESYKYNQLPPTTVDRFPKLINEKKFIKIISEGKITIIANSILESYFDINILIYIFLFLIILFIYIIKKYEDK